MSSCKKLLGLDPDSLLAKDIWEGDEATININGNTNHFDISDIELEFNKKTHRYKVYNDGDVDDEGDWNYDKKNEILTLDSDDDDTVEFHVLELTKTKLTFEYKHDMNNDGTLDVITYYFERD
jgi:hypothetical protein